MVGNFRLGLYGFLVSQHGQLGAIPPPPCLTVSPLGEHAKWRCDTPPKRGISAILARYHMKARQMGAIPPSAILSRKGIARYGGVSRTGLLSACLALVGPVSQLPALLGEEDFHRCCSPLCRLPANLSSGYRVRAQCDTTDTPGWYVQGECIAQECLLNVEHFSGPQKGPERGHVKKRQKSSKSGKNIFDTFRHFSRRAKIVKNRQKVSKIF